jgi:SdrD B-like domain
VKPGQATPDTSHQARRRFLKQLLALAGAAAALSAAPVSSQPASAAPYVDRVLDAGPQSEQAPEGGQAAVNPDGWARSLRLDYALSSQKGPSSTLTRAIQFAGFLDTPNHGALSLSGSLSSQQVDGVSGDRGGSGSGGGNWRIDQRALPLDGGWMADHSAGNISTWTPSMARGLGRIYLPFVPMSGIGGHWYRGDALDLNASTGNPGLFTGLNTNGFASTGGRVSSAGGQMLLAGERNGLSRTEAAVQLMDASNVPDASAPSGLNARSLWAALAWEGAAPWATTFTPGRTDPIPLRSGGLRVQGNWMETRTDLGDRSVGGWLDAAWRTDWLQNSAGVFYLEPNLRWGPTTAASDLKGAYWRADTSARRWNLGWTIEGSDSVSGQSGRSAFASAYGRYSLDTRNTLGATLSLRSGSGSGEALQLNWDRGSEWGQTQWRGTVQRIGGIRTVFAGVDQEWTLGLPLTLSTAIGWEQSRAAGLTASVRTWGLLAGYAPTSQLNVDASVRGAKGEGTSALNANIGVSWRYNMNWSVIGRYNESHGQDPQSTQLVSALTSATLTPLLPVPASRTLQLILRYENRAGTVSAPLGGTPGTAAGALQGTVFFDTDSNGRRDASETGVPNVTVVLDRRFVVRTDAQGRYEFPWVAAGAHTLQIQSDNVPLPWSPVQRDPAPVSVVVRSTTVTDFALQRDR